MLIHAKGELGDILHAVEFLDADSMSAVLDYHNCRRTKFPFQRDFPFYAMVETASQTKSNEEESQNGDLDRMFGFLGKIEDHIIDGTVA